MNDLETSKQELLKSIEESDSFVGYIQVEGGIQTISHVVGDLHFLENLALVHLRQLRKYLEHLQEPMGEILDKVEEMIRVCQILRKEGAEKGLKDIIDKLKANSDSGNKPNINLDF